MFRDVVRPANLKPGAKGCKPKSKLPSILSSIFNRLDCSVVSLRGSTILLDRIALLEDAVEISQECAEYVSMARENEQSILIKFIERSD